MTFTFNYHKMKPPSMLYNYRSVPLVTGINKPRSETDLFLEQKKQLISILICFGYLLGLRAGICVETI